MNLWEILGEQLKITHMYIILCTCIFNFGLCKLQFSSRTLHVRVALESQYLFVVVARPIPANQNVKNFQIFHISAGSVASSFCWYQMGSVKYYKFCNRFRCIIRQIACFCMGFQSIYNLIIYNIKYGRHSKIYAYFHNISSVILFLWGGGKYHVKKIGFSAVLLISTI